jgi:hypothetical protein
MMKKSKVRDINALSIICLMIFTLFTQLFAERPRVSITVTFPDGQKREATAWETTPLEIAKEISKSMSERTVIAKV